MRTNESSIKIDYRVEIENTIEAFFVSNIQRSNTIHPHYKTLWTTLHQLISSGGKRIRPLMTLMAYEAFGGSDTAAILPIAAAQELLHLSMLIHDDIIDRDHVRYGVDNISGSYIKLYSSLVPDEEDRLHYAQSSALLAGDLLISGSYDLITQASVIPQKIIAAQQLLAESIFEVAGGELLDTESAFRYADEIKAETIAYYKTASYTFIGPLLTGTILAGASQDDQRTIRQFAENLGIAYQFTDDIIGIFGDEQKTGKSNTSDIREGKRTFMIEQFYSCASPEQKEQFERYFAMKNITPYQAERIRKLLVLSGARKKTEDAIEFHSMNARLALKRLTITEKHYEALNNLVATVTKREY
jgi:geranylgeranyl pyrophosphate synthase